MAAPVLDARQEAFCKAYLAGNSITGSAIAAGYSRRSASVSGSRLLKRAKVRDYLAAAKAATRTEAAIDLEAARRLCSEIATDLQERSMVRLAAVSLLSRLSNWDLLPPPEVQHLRTEIAFVSVPDQEAPPGAVQEAHGSDRAIDPPDRSPRLLEASLPVLEASEADPAHGSGLAVATAPRDPPRRWPRISPASRRSTRLDF